MHIYPINVFTNQYKDDVVKLVDQIDQFGKNGNWEELVEILTTHSGFVNSTQLVVQNENHTPPLFTPLHYAADGSAPKRIFEKLIKLGATKCLKTAAGETAYDIAKTKGLNPDILQLLDIPTIIKEKSNEIDIMETALHGVILGRMEKLIKENGQALPQLAVFYEKGRFHYPVPRMYGGFNVSEHEKGIEVFSFIRVCGGSEQSHLIDTQGNVTLLQSGYE